MARRISLSRAARLVGVKRGTLQQKIRAGELKTFEGEILLTDLLQAYPDAQVEDSSMLERVEQIIEQATFINPERGAHIPDRLVLNARIMSLSQELARHKRLLAGYRQLTGELARKLAHPEDRADAPQRLKDWLAAAEARISGDNATIDPTLINETFLRVMSAQATVIPSGHEFFVEGAESILEAGLRGGLALNYGCSNGICGLCRIRVVTGEVRKIRHHDYALTEAEKGLGYVLGCSNTALTDVVLEADEASSTSDIPLQRIPVRIKKIDKPAGDVLIVSTRTPRTSRLRFLAGQGATLSIDGVGSAFYPIASCPCDDMNLQFHVARDPGDPLAGYLVESARTNEQIELEGPVGSFVLNEDSPNSLVFIAEGIGFASIKGLIEHAMALDVAEKIYLFWIAPDGTAHYLNNLCRAWNDAFDNFEYLPLDSSIAGKFEATVVSSLAPHGPAEFDYYYCGGDGMRGEVERFADAQAVPKTRIRCQLTQPAGKPG